MPIWIFVNISKMFVRYPPDGVGKERGGGRSFRSLLFDARQVGVGICRHHIAK